MNVLTLPRYLTHLSIEQTNVNPITALHHHPEIPLIIDALSRYYRHHLLLIGTSSDKINQAIIESVVVELSSLHHTKSIQNAHFFYCDVTQLLLEEKSPETLEKDLFRFKQEAAETQKPIILILNQAEPLTNHAHPAFKLINAVIPDNQWRLIIFTDSALSSFENSFSIIQLTEPNESELLSLLKQYRTNLENFHQVTIPDDIISSALTMIDYYLYSSSRFDKALEILDSSASRTYKNNKADNSAESKPIVTHATLTNVISSLTGIPSSCIQNNKFQAKQFLASIDQHIFGQEKAVSLVSSIMQQAYIKFHDKQGPLCSFLFAGQNGTGKTGLAHAIAKYLFGHENAILSITLDQRFSSLSDIKISNKQPLNFLDAIRQTPYAVILIDDIHPEQISLLELFKDLFTKGFVIEKNEKYDFSHAIVIMTTNIASEAIQLPHPAQQEQNTTPDLLQLILNENVLDLPFTQSHDSYSPQEISEQLMPILSQHFPSSLLQKTHVVPFLPLDSYALEKMIRLKIKSLIKMLETRFAIELNYAPEVIKFLTEKVYSRQPNVSLEKILEQLLYSCIAYEVLANNQDKNRFKRLLLQLDEQGQSLKCEGVTEVSLPRV